MADISKGPHTSRTETTQAAPSTDLSALSMAPDFMHLESPGLPIHTKESVERKWAERTFDTGTTIECRQIRGAA